ncbi:MAG: DUF3592 domain-containing protein [Rubrivivax sp.]
MSQGKAAAAPGKGSRIATAIFSGLFMLAFGAGGLLGGVLPIALALWRALEATTWQPVPAQVIEARLDESPSKKGGSTYAVKARYAYRVNGRDLEGHRVGLLDWGSDNIGTWHQDWKARLDDARQREEPVVAWVDPDAPERSVLDRRVRGGLMALHLPFALLFTAVGVGAGVVFWRAVTGREAPPARRGGHTAAAGRTRAGRLAPGVRGRLDQGRGELVFTRWWPLVLALGMTLPALMVLVAVPAGGGLAQRLLVAAAGTAWLALALHVGTLRWSWQRQEDGLLLVRRSWLHARRWTLDRGHLARAEPELVFTSSTGGGPQVKHHRLVLKLDDGRTLALTPALQGPEALAAVRQHLRQALAPAKRRP